MVEAGPNDKIYPVGKLAAIVDALAAEVTLPADALGHIQLSEEAISSPNTRVSLNQLIECCRLAMKLSRDPFFAYRAGLKFHVSTYGLYGFSILSSTNFRQTMQFAVRYHQLAVPLANISFREQDGHGIWTINPVPHPAVDAPLYRFLVEMQFGMHISLHRDVMGPAFTPQELHVTYAAFFDMQQYHDAFACNVLFGRADNELVFDAAWLDAIPQLGNKITYSVILKMCGEMLDEFQLRKGLSGKVREALLVNLTKPTSLDAIARFLKMSPRTLRRKLQGENTSFRKLLDELRMHVAIKYLRDTDFTVDEIGYALGFGDAANFRHAFHRWTKLSPHQFRTIAGKT